MVQIKAIENDDLITHCGPGGFFQPRSLELPEVMPRSGFGVRVEVLEFTGEGLE